ncbi:hypothetical protein MWU75_00160 [Ornithinimicrobium sp. F0845]|uniref:hypothetical protein n=1 Tax=Ornithinimicrobium sp. F0845 TaxID=2926412 RepID=UPI001FF3C6CB|nr:hypothetical protein [Ornithinimicrobium sp. F0845]MCK0110561.1 hypothetical protein [Ornithinimicrobium sp. F0845]
MSERDHIPEPVHEARLATLLREEAARASDGILPPPLEELQSRGISRRRRPWLVGAAALAAAAVIGAVVWANLPSTDGQVGPAGEFVPPADGPIADTFEVPTFDWDESGGDGALVAGALAFTDAGCPLLVFGESATPLFFPNATGVTYDNGVRGVVDAQGRVYATEGQPMEYAGGWAEPMTGELAQAWDSLCADTPARDAVYVNDIAAIDPLAESPEVPGDLPTVPTTREEAGWFDVPTYAFDPDGPREDALIEGTVEFTDEGCPVVETDGVRTGLIFPNAEGFQAPGTDDPRLVYSVFGDGSSAAMAQEGEPVSWGGGGGPADDERWTSVCQESPVDAVFIVQDTPFD